MYSPEMIEEITRIRRREAQRAAEHNRLADEVRALHADPQPGRVRRTVGSKLIRLGLSLTGARTDIIIDLTQTEPEPSC
jgi:hypothetical protein